MHLVGLRCSRRRMCSRQAGYAGCPSRTRARPGKSHTPISLGSIKVLRLVIRRTGCWKAPRNASSGCYGTGRSMREVRKSKYHASVHLTSLYTGYWQPVRGYVRRSLLKNAGLMFHVSQAGWQNYWDRGKKIGNAIPNEVQKRRGTGIGYGKMSHMSVLNTHQ
jgi:hypothetical protein